MNELNFKDFQNICRTCLLTCDNKLLKNHVISEIYYKLTDICFDLNNELPQQLCLKCYEKMIEMHAFSLQCKHAHYSLMECLNGFKRIEEEQHTNLPETIEFVAIKEEITTEEDNIEMVEDEDFLTNENVFDELQAQPENKKNTSDELRISKTSEINKDENINCDQDNFNDISEDYTNQNDLNENTSSISTNRTNIINISSLVSNETSERPYKCEICPKTFKSRMNLISHKRVHCDKPVLCKVCAKSFKYTSELNKHMRVHSGERPYVCEYCKKSFYQVQSLNIHKRIHSGERPYECEICNKTFIQSSQLSAHKRIHSGVRPYVCDTCNKSFTQLGHLKQHERIHSNECPYICDICNKAFKYTASLYAHKKTHK